MIAFNAPLLVFSVFGHKKNEAGINLVKPWQKPEKLVFSLRHIFLDSVIRRTKIELNKKELIMKGSVNFSRPERLGFMAGRMRKAVVQSADAR